MNTKELLEKYLNENKPYEGIDFELTDYRLNGNIIKLSFYYNPQYDWDKTFVKYGNFMEIELLDYITWVAQLHYL